MQFFRSLYLTNRFFVLLLASAGLFVFGFFYAFFLVLAKVYFIGLLIFLLLDVMMVYGNRAGIEAKRILADKLSNGDDNQVIITLHSRYAYPVRLTVIDEVPIQFQQRDTSYSLWLDAGKEKLIHYFVHPVKRGEYSFGRLNVYISSILFLLRKRVKYGEEQIVPVYPSYLQMRKYELMAISSRLTEAGIKKIRKIGRTMEFDQVRDYVRGDDVRSINWKATARKADLMVNQYQDEKSQQLYCIIDKGRVMKMPFEGLSLLDYAINASLVISNIAQLKHDKPGLITFSEKISAFVPAERKGIQMQRILEVLYNQKTRYQESSFELLYAFCKRRITHRSLLLFFTNFESLSSMRRQLPYLKMLAKNHLLVLIFFENTELKTLLHHKAESVEEVYIKTIAEQFAFEKRQIVKELARHGIHAILSAPQQLTVNTINKYLEIKSRGLI